MRTIVECVPNFSEGQDAEKIEAIVGALLAGPDVYLLGREMDADHNRSVVTIAGEPSAVIEAAVRGVGKAVELIDLTRQQGVHPRIGAADVIPFVPVSGIKLEQCVLLARQTGLEIWRRFGVPIYFYEAAASRPDRVNLEDRAHGHHGSQPLTLAEAAAWLRESHERRRCKLCVPDIQEPGWVKVGRRWRLIEDAE